MLETRELTRRFGGLVAVHRVSLAVARGEVRSIIGPNGAGKTTLFNLITGALAPSEGRIFFKGGDVTGLAPPAIFRLGVVRSFQVSHLFPKLSVWQNVELMVYGRVRSSGSPFARVRESATGVKRRVTTALDRLGIGGRAEEMAGTLSHGDRRLVEIAMALAAEPELLLLDEPTAGMSPQETRTSVALVARIARERKLTVLFTEHDMDVVFSVAQRIRVLHQGRLIAEGAPEEIRGLAEVKRVYFGEGAIRTRRAP